MANPTHSHVDPINDPDMTWRGVFSLEQREAMIRDAAYYHFAKRGYAHGHDREDWLTAEAEIERIASASPELPSDTAMQQSAAHSARTDDALKRIVRQHPQNAIPQIESIEPEKAPFRE